MSEHEKQAQELVAHGWPALADRMPELLSWLEDPNCTAYPVVADFLASVGAPIVPHLRETLAGRDDEVKGALIRSVLGELPRDAVAELGAELLRIARGWDVEDAHIDALDLLARHRIGDPAVLQRLIANKRSACETTLRELAEIEASLGE